MKNRLPKTVHYIGWVITYEKLPQRVFLRGEHAVADGGSGFAHPDGWYLLVDTEHGLCIIDGDDLEASETNRIYEIPIGETI